LIKKFLKDTTPQIPANLSKTQKKKLEKVLNDFLFIVSNAIDERETYNSGEIKSFILGTLTNHILNISIRNFIRFNTKLYSLGIDEKIILE
jgi:hypothetical protein